VKQVRCPSFSIGSDALYDSGHSLLSSNNPLLKKVVQADLLIANRSDTWTYQVLHALQDFPTSQQFLNAIQSKKLSI